jgi:hypothetical protein
MNAQYARPPVKRIARFGAAAPQQGRFRTGIRVEIAIGIRIRNLASRIKPAEADSEKQRAEWICMSERSIAFTPAL